VTRAAEASKEDREAALVIGDLIEEHGGRLPTFSPSTDAPEQILADRVFHAAISQWLATRKRTSTRYGIKRFEMALTGGHWAMSYGCWLKYERFPATEILSATSSRRSRLSIRNAIETNFLCLFCSDAVATLGDRRISKRAKSIPDAILRDVLAHTVPCGIQWLARLHATGRAS
jgi:hypothetical protein